MHIFASDDDDPLYSMSLHRFRLILNNSLGKVCVAVEKVCVHILAK